MISEGYQDWDGKRALPEECEPTDRVDVTLEDGRKWFGIIVSELRWVHYVHLRDKKMVRPRGNIIAWRFTP